MVKFNLNQLLNNVSVNSDIEETETNKVNAFKVSLISIYDLIQSEENFYSVGNIEELKDSIEMFGIKQNLTVKATEDGKYIVIAGHRRRLASLALVEEGKKEFEFLPCSIENDLDHIKEQLLLITTNSTTRQLTDWEKTQQAEKIKELLNEYKKKEKLPGRTREIIASILSTSPTQIARMDSISNNLTQEFKEEFKNENINISTAYELSTLPEGVQESIYIEHTENGGVTLNDVKEKKAEIKAEEEGSPVQEEKAKEQDEDEDEVKEKTELKKEPVEALPPMPSLYKILKEFSLSELAEFICSRCDGLGRFCDYAMECNQSKKTKRHAICIKWLEMQAQKGN